MLVRMHSHAFFRMGRAIGKVSHRSTKPLSEDFTLTRPVLPDKYFFRKYQMVTCAEKGGIKFAEYIK